MHVCSFYLEMWVVGVKKQVWYTLADFESDNKKLWGKAVRYYNTVYRFKNFTDTKEFFTGSLFFVVFALKPIFLKTDEHRQTVKQILEID